MMVERRMESTVGKRNELHFIIVIKREFICDLSSPIAQKIRRLISRINSRRSNGEKTNSSHEFRVKMCVRLKFVWMIGKFRMITSVQNFLIIFFFSFWTATNSIVTTPIILFYCEKKKTVSVFFFIDSFIHFTFRIGPLYEEWKLPRKKT